MDAWVHEQDIRRALDIPGELDGPVAAHSVGRFIRAMPFVIARKVQERDGSTVVFNITGPAGRVVSVGVAENRGSELETEPTYPTVGITTDVETFACLACGRWKPSDVLDSGRITLSGDTTMGQRIINQMNIMI